MTTVFALVSGDGQPANWRLTWFYNTRAEAESHCPPDDGTYSKWAVQEMTVAEALNKLAVAFVVTRFDGTALHGFTPDVTGKLRDNPIPIGDTERGDP